jgi:hypothetical protein
MKKLRNFNCKYCGVVEALVEDDKRTVKCECGAQALRLVSAPRYTNNTTGKSPCW